MLRAVVPPLLLAYSLFLILVLRARHRPVPRPRTGSPWLGPHRAGLIRHIAVTVAGGYLVFVGIVIVFHSWLATEPAALRSAFVEGSILALAVFALFGASASLPTRRR